MKVCNNQKECNKVIGILFISKIRIRIRVKIWTRHGSGEAREGCVCVCVCDYNSSPLTLTYQRIRQSDIVISKKPLISTFRD